MMNANNGMYGHKNMLLSGAMSTPSHPTGFSNNYSLLNEGLASGHSSNFGGSIGLARLKNRNNSFESQVPRYFDRP